VPFGNETETRRIGTVDIWTVTSGDPRSDYRARVRETGKEFSIVGHEQTSGPWLLIARAAMRIAEGPLEEEDEPE